MKFLKELSDGQAARLSSLMATKTRLNQGTLCVIKKANSKYCELGFQGLHLTIIYYIWSSLVKTSRYYLVPFLKTIQHCILEVIVSCLYSEQKYLFVKNEHYKLHNLPTYILWKIAI